jgi:hypothetical protein
MMKYQDWIAVVIKVLEEFSSQEFQERVWLKGEGPEVSSYEEAVNRFFDDYAADQLIDVQWRQAGLTKDKQKKLAAFRDALGAFDKLVPKVPHPQEILANPEWDRVRAAARIALDELAERTGTQARGKF